MKVNELQNEILRLKKENDVCILAHSYQAQKIQEIADYTGDSFGLSVQAAKAAHPDALVLVHPECKPEVVELADYVGSTTGIIDYARKSEHKEFIIGTEISIAEALSYEFPEKYFYPLSKDLVCHNMKITTLIDVYRAVNGGGTVIELPDDVIAGARRCIDRMIELG